MNEKIIELKSNHKSKPDTEKITSQLQFTKNFRSASAEEWYIFLPGYSEPEAIGKVFIHYNLYGNRDVFINTTIIFGNPSLHSQEQSSLVLALADEIINRLVGYADTLLSVHSGENSYDAEYINRDSE